MFVLPAFPTSVVHGRPTCPRTCHTCSMALEYRRPSMLGLPTRHRCHHVASILHS